MSMAFASPAFDQTLDRREAILERLMQIGAGLSGIKSTWRNHGPTETGDLGVDRPAFLLFDGGARLTPEHLDLVRRHKRPQFPTTIWRMDPQLVVILPNRDTVENLTYKGNPAPVGPELASWMSLIHASVTNDDQLVDLVTANGNMVLAGFETDLKVQRAIGAYGAWLMMQYEFEYPLFPPH